MGLGSYISLFQAARFKLKPKPAKSYTMPIDYQNTKIYTLVNSVNQIIYVGFTTQSLKDRKSGHVSSSVAGTSDIYFAMRTIGADKFSIALHHAFPCNSKKEAEVEEYKTLQELIDAGTAVYNLKTTGNKQAASTIAKMTGENNPNFNCGFITYRVGPRRIRQEWQFRYRVNNAGVTKGFSIRKYGFWEAKEMAEAERKRIYPHWKNDEEVACEEFGLIEW